MSKEKDFLEIISIPELHNFLNKYYFAPQITRNEKELNKINNLPEGPTKDNALSLMKKSYSHLMCVKLYTSTMVELKKIYQDEFGKKPPLNINIIKIKKELKSRDTYINCSEVNFHELCEKTIDDNIDDIDLLQWLEQNGGYESIELSREVLLEEFFQRLNNNYYKTIIPENNICNLNLSLFRERVATQNRGIYANVLSVSKILRLPGGPKLLDDLVYCISAKFGMPKLKVKEDYTIQLSEISKHYHTIKETIDINTEEKLVLYFNWNKSIIFCEGFQIKEIIPGINNIDFAIMEKGLYNYILVCFDTENDKKYRLYMAEAQPLEIGSKHWNIMTKINEDLLIERIQANTKVVIITAGEMNSTLETLYFNFFSGTIFTKLLQGECEVITGLNYDENTDERCHNTIYDYFLGPFMKHFFQQCNTSEDFSFEYTNEHLINNEKLKEEGILFEQAYYEKLQKLEEEGCDIVFGQIN